MPGRPRNHSMPMNLLAAICVLILGFQVTYSLSVDLYQTEALCGDLDYSDYAWLVVKWALLGKHNKLRSKLANGTQKNGNIGNQTFPTASSMSALKYECQLEETARNISKQCLNVTDPNFDHVGANYATFNLNYSYNHDLLTYLLSDELADSVYGWWNTSINDTPLVNLTPTYNDSRKIPFLQMANAATTKLGCAYSICNRSFVSFVCQYGKPHVNVGIPIYKNGTPCSECDGECKNSLCV
ncbi:hypothetical protein KIN20_025425 [Parelaphostrongylus tenuis]|uniref:SCP domain-containing protein n=1 Tax=Parelaphostrongylus tenuis TaxID=148309 RepID=A0AAD5MV79_PARTN|nr:hypothetical protein KIN20_025425 [Parelaphostrongylus tenuis]